MTHQDRAIKTLRQQIGWHLWLRNAVIFTTVFAFVFGTAVLVARAAWGTDRLTLAWGAAGLIPIVAAAWWVMARRMPTPAMLRAIVDRQSDAGGLIMAGEETELGWWENRIGQTRSPRVRWSGGRNWTALLLGAVFVGVAFGLPDSIASVMGPGSQEFAQTRSDQLQEMIDTLEEEEIITSDEAETLEQKLEQIKQDAVGNDPSKTWEAMDNIQAMLDKAAEEATERAVQQASMLNELEQLAEDIEKAMAQSELTPEELAKLAEAGEAVDPQDLADAMKAASEMVEQAMEDSEAFEKLMDPGLAEKLKELAKLDPQSLKEMGELSPEAIAQLNEIAEHLEEIEADSFVHLSSAGDATVFDPDQTMKLAQLKAGNKPTEEVAVRLTSEAVFRKDPTVMMTIELDAMGEGERMVAMKDNDEIAVYKLDKKTKVDITKLGVPTEEIVLVVQPDGVVHRYVYSPEESAQFQAAQGEAEQVFRITAQTAKLSQEQVRQLVQRLHAQGIITDQQIAEAQQAMQDANGKPGRGGLNRGRGDAPMTWKDPSSEEGSKFEEQTLPPASLAAIRDSQVVGASVGAPTLDDGGGASSGGALAGAAAGGGSANTQVILPEHRGSVQRYFERE